MAVTFLSLTGARRSLPEAKPRSNMGILTFSTHRLGVFSAEPQLVYEILIDYDGYAEWAPLVANPASGQRGRARNCGNLSWFTRKRARER